MRSLCSLGALLATLSCAYALYTGPFLADIWTAHEGHVKQDAHVSFIVALNLRDHQGMHDTLMRVSNPKSPQYGQYLTLEDIQERFGPSEASVHAVVDWLSSSMPSASIQVNLNRDMISVTATVNEIEQGFNTRLQFHQHSLTDRSRPALRAVESIHVPEQLHDAISFVSLNSPVSRHIPMSGRALRSEQQKTAKQAEAASVTVSSGNKAVAIHFKVTCNDGSGNVDTIPCSSVGDIPTITAAFQRIDDVFPPTLYTITGDKVSCFDTNNAACAGTAAASDCTCTTRINNVAMYYNMRVNVTGTFSDGSSKSYGGSEAFALADVATPQFLYDLYDIPYGIKIEHGSDMAVAEFYGEFYSNSDLATFMELSGLAVQQINESLVLGNNPNDEDTPGGEAMLDVEYILALAPGAELWFYSIADLNPYSSENEGFLTWLYIVGNQTNPPLVQSLSYLDIEAAIFNQSRPGSSEYAYRCDEEFIKMGLRGITVVVASGDDGLGSFAIRTNPTWACAESRPNWPASSPYVTTLGATMLSDQNLPICKEFYAANVEPLPVECTNVAETTCEATLGGVITPGGGFSNIYDREEYAPWQDAFVDAYLELDGVTPSSPGYFNPSGRAYPDVAAYGSNYFVLLDGQIMRESGTSASTPVFAAMVALWNDMRFAYDMPPMGFMNPFLYTIAAEHPEAFTDITTGNNACGVGHSIDSIDCCEEYFTAAAGWDAVNGLGSPKFNVIANLVLNNATYFPAQGAYLVPSCECASGDNGKDGTDANESVLYAALALGCLAFVLGVGALMSASKGKQ